MAYTIGDPAQDGSFANWTTSMTHCGPITYTALDNTTGLALDSALITTTFNDTANTFTVSSSLVAKAGIYTVRIVGTSVSPGGETFTDFTTFKLTVTDPCLTATLSSAANANLTYYVSDPALSAPINAINSTVPDAICGTLTYNVTDAPTGAALADPPFTSDNASPPTLSVSATDGTLKGVRTVSVTG
jgi:hypothetical protein